MNRDSVNTRKRVVVIGAGIIGVSSAVSLARAGATVVLVDEKGLAAGASGRSLSWLNSSGTYSAAYHRLRTLGIDRYRTRAAAGASSDYLQFGGGLRWMTAAAAPALRELFDHERAHGYDAHWLTPDQVATTTPGVDAAAVSPDGAVFNPGEGWVDLVPLVHDLAQEFLALGGRLVQQAGPTEVSMAGSRVTGVVTTDGTRIEADAVLVATGAAVPAMTRSVGVELPAQTTNALLVRTKKVDVALNAVLNTPRVSLRPAPGGTLVMDSGWSQRAVVERDGGWEVPDGVVEELLTEASRVLEGNPRLELERYFVGRKPIPGDGEPVLGALDSVDGYHVAFTHSGATIGLIAGELLADTIVRDVPHPLLDAFQPSRFR
ncbi:NAD(P)/FAD-dependent oxidoreductase [Rathayibacter soli]|uniref:NAD(P)/FAD-dependent oxidoreductase n=1 Tax=Rathayibacter soli TaxID=3144168 RepID=UPI0039083C95